MSEMVERVARALVASRFGNEGLMMFDPVPDGFPNSSEARMLFSKRVGEARKDARAAIEAMTEPTDAMVNAAREHHEGQAYLPYSLFSSMIQAALKEQA